MTTVSFGGPGGTGHTGFFPLTSGPIGLPAGRAMANGSTACLLTGLVILVGGDGGVRSVSASLAGAGWTLAAPSGAAGAIGAVTNTVLVNGGAANLSITANGALNFGRAGGGTTSDGHTSFAGTIGGSYDYVQAPNAPTIGAVSSSALGSATVAFTPATDNGGAAISTHRVEYSTDNFATIAGYKESTGSPVTITGLTPGVVYYFRVAARNAVTDVAGTVGPYSAKGSVSVVGGVKVGKAGAWVMCAVYVGVNGQWVPAQVFAGRAGSWVGLTT